jgi:hypothetical protein
MNIFLFLKKINKISYIFINIIILLFSNFAFANEEKDEKSYKFFDRYI